REIVIDIADAEARLWNGIPAPAAFGLVVIAPFALVIEIERRLVMELRVPAPEGCDIDQQVIAALRRMGERARPDHAELQGEIIEAVIAARLIGRVLHQADTAIEPSGIRAVAGIGIDQRRVLRRVNVLAE